MMNQRATIQSQISDEKSQLARNLLTRARYPDCPNSVDEVILQCHMMCYYILRMVYYQSMDIAWVANGYEFDGMSRDRRRLIKAALKLHRRKAYHYSRHIYGESIGKRRHRCHACKLQEVVANFFSRCGLCSVHYCTRQCCKTDWNVHKKVCVGYLAQK